MPLFPNSPLLDAGRLPAAARDRFACCTEPQCITRARLVTTGPVDLQATYTLFTTETRAEIGVLSGRLNQQCIREGKQATKVLWNRSCSNCKKRTEKHRLNSPKSSHVQRTFGTNMGTILSYFWGSSEGDVPDPGTTLTPNEKKAIRETWEAIYAKKVENGVAFFIRIFVEHPEFKKLFKNLEGIDDLEKLAKHPRMKAHGVRVMASFNSFIENLDDVDVLVQLLVDIGISHSKHKVTEEQFDALGGVVVWLVENKSGRSYSEFAKQAWIKAWTVMKPIIVKALNDAYEAQKKQ